MNIVVCLDDRNGLCFNHRRQSQDRVVRSHIMELCKGSKLWMNHYSSEQFENAPELGISVDEDCLSKAQAGEWCFVEDMAVAPHLQRIEKVIVFRWNRVYPSDRYFDIDMKGCEWRCVKQTEFTGYSHDRVTMEVYQR